MGTSAGEIQNARKRTKCVTKKIRRDKAPSSTSFLLPTLTMSAAADVNCNLPTPSTEDTVACFLRDINLTSSSLSSIALPLPQYPPQSISYSHLEVLRLDRNNLSSLPNEFLSLTSLKILFLGFNQFQLFPSILKEMRSLEMISFRDNHLTEIPEDHLPASLKWLILTNNHLSHLPASIGKLTKLRKLMLANNELASLPSELSQCSQLELIRLASNRLQEIPSWLFSHLPRLAWISLAGNPCLPTPSARSSSCPLISAADMEVGEPIGEGASGVVYKAICSSLSASSPLSQGTEYAIKFFKNGATSDGNTEDEKNISLSLPSHPSLIPVLATMLHPETLLFGLVLPLIPSSYIPLALPPSFASITRDVYRSDDSFTLPLTLSILLGISSCCALLHSQGIMHGDLYGHNILITRENLLTAASSSTLPRPDIQALSPFLVDFGAATCYGVERAVEGLLELIEVNAFSKLLEELLSRTFFPEDEKGEEVENRLKSLCETCGATDLQKRPRFREIENALRCLTEEIEWS
jgi:hypothetical protein